MKNQINPIADFLKEKRKKLQLTQPELATKAGVGLRFIRELESGKTTLRMDKVNQVLKLFGAELGLTAVNREQWLSAGAQPVSEAKTKQQKKRRNAKR